VDAILTDRHSTLCEDSVRAVLRYLDLPEHLSRQRAALLVNAIDRLLLQEHRALTLFSEWQSRLHCSLGWNAPPHQAVAALLTSTFGSLPREYITRVFGRAPTTLQAVFS
jgi:hypothetical protein